MTLFVANFDKRTEKEDLEELFREYGEVTDVKIFRDRETDESLGYGFVEMADDWDAERAMKRLNGRWWNGRRLKVTERRPRDKDEDDEDILGSYSWKIRKH